MKKIKIYFGILLFILLMIFATKVNAAGSISLSASKSTVNVGDEFSISVNLSGASVATLTTRVSIDTSKVDYVSGPSNSSFSNGRALYTWTDPTGGSNPKTGGTIVTFKFRAKQAGKASFSVSGDYYDSNENPVKPSFSGTTVTIQEKVVTPPTTPNTPSTPTTPTTPSTPSAPSTPSTPSTPSGGGSNTGSSGNTGGTSTTVSTNANLKALHLNVEGMTPAFSKNTTSYYITVPNSISSINVTAEAEDNNAKISVSGNTDLKTGLNKISIVVTAADNKTKKTYTVNVTKTDDPDSANANLENLAIENVVLDPEFNADITQYNASIASNHDTLNILAVPQIEGATVNIQGKDNIQFGDNTITVSVTAKDGVTIKDYIINLHKKTEEEEIKEAELLRSTDEQNELLEENEITAGDIVFITIIVAGVGGIIIILIRKYIKEKNNKNL